MLIGAGNVISGAVFVFGAKWINKLNRTVLLAMLVTEKQNISSLSPNYFIFYFSFRYFMIHFSAFTMIFVNIPAYANQGETNDPPMHLDKPNKGMASCI